MWGHQDIWQLVEGMTRWPALRFGRVQVLPPHIQRRSANPSVAQRGVNGILIDDRAARNVDEKRVSLRTGHGSRETESAEGRRLFLVTYRPSILSSRAAGAKAVSGIAGSGENCVARLFGHAANPVEVDADEFTLPFHHLAGDEHVLDVAGVH